MSKVTITITDDEEMTHVEHDITERYDPENPSGALYYGNAILIFLQEFGGFQPEAEESEVLDVDSNNEQHGLLGESEHIETEERLPEESS
jgi:hypothetical protein